MRVLIIGAGGREHALAHKFSLSEKVTKVFAAPGNAGFSPWAKTVNYCEKEEILTFCRKEKIDLIFIGPEQPLALGWADYFRSHRILTIGPSEKAARIETSKAFAKNLMRKYKIPTAAFAEINGSEEALAYLQNAKYPLVIKTDGLAAGKGVCIVRNFSEGKAALSELQKYGNTYIIEEFMQGWEASVFAFCDGKNFVSTIFSQDHKRVFDGDLGPNTGGMGAYAPCKNAESYKEQVDREIFAPILEAMTVEDCPFSGVLYAGLMFTPAGPKVVEFNCRFGDPETEALLPLLKTDLADICLAIAKGQVDTLTLDWEEAFCITVVGAMQGYPGAYPRGETLRIARNFEESNCTIYYAGVKKQDGKLLTDGGRVFMLTAKNKELKQAQKTVYEGMQKINFKGMFYRRDIAQKALENE